MIREMILPQLAMGMSEGTVVEWLAKEGTRVEREQPLVAVETEKVVTDLPAPYSGFVHIVVGVGQKVPVETLIAQIAETEDEYSEVSGAALAEETPKTPTEVPVTPKDDAVPVPSQSAFGNEAREKIRASGLAKTVARQHGIDLFSVGGTGPGGRIVRRDVDRAVQERKAREATSPVTAASVSGGMREKARIPLTGVRRTIAERMVKAKNTAAHTYLFFEIDITKLISVRETMLGREQELGTRISFTAIYAKALALACQWVPVCNSTLVGEEIIVWESVNVGIAVALPGKTDYESRLLVPVVRDVERKGVLQIDQESKDLIARARADTLAVGDMVDGTITLSSTAGFLPGAWMVSTPLLNLPQVMNFQPGSPVRKPVVLDGEIAVRTVLPCGLSFDHRAMDGEPAGRFVRKICDLLSNPELMML